MLSLRSVVEREGGRERERERFQGNDKKGWFYGNR